MRDLTYGVWGVRSWGAFPSLSPLFLIPFPSHSVTGISAQPQKHIGAFWSKKIFFFTVQILCEFHGKAKFVTLSYEIHQQVPAELAVHFCVYPEGLKIPGINNRIVSNV